MSTTSEIQSSREHDADRRARRRALLIGAALYLVGALAIFANVLATSPTRSSTCPCSDPSLFASYFEWTYRAIVTGHNPFFTTAVFHPQGANLLSNTSSMALGVVLIPVTALFGPLASVNLALIAAPAASALAAMWLAQRWTASPVGAFVAGALFGFSPLVLFESAGGHLMMTFLVIPPLVLACLDELFWRRHRSPIKVGVGLGLLVVIQFFIGTELLMILAITCAASLVVLGVAGFVTDRAATITAIRSGLPGVLTATAIAIGILAVPAAYALLGPQHYSGVIWKNVPYPSVSLHSFFIPEPGLPLWWDTASPAFTKPSFLGPVLLVVMIAGPIAFRRDRRMVAAAVIALIVGILSLGKVYAFAPWHYLGSLPILENVFNDRFTALLMLPVGLVLVRFLDAVRSRWSSRGTQVISWSIVALCVAPLILIALPSLPYRANRVWEPAWYSRNASTLKPSTVILGLNNGGENFLAIQAIHEMHYSLVGGGPPKSLSNDQGPETPGWIVLRNFLGGTSASTTASPAERGLVLSAIKGWRVTDVVIPITPAPKSAGQTRTPRQMEQFMSSIVGPPSVVDGAWTWRLRS